MLAIIVESADTVDTIHDMFQSHEGKVFLSSAGAPLGNGIGAAKFKMVLVIFDVIEEIDHTLQQSLIERLGTFNVTPRQAIGSINKRHGYLAELHDMYQTALARVLVCLRFHVRIYEERRRMLKVIATSHKLVRKNGSGVTINARVCRKSGSSSNDALGCREHYLLYLQLHFIIPLVLNASKSV